MMVRIALLTICASFAAVLAGFSPVSAATRHVVLLFDERVELPGLSSLDAEFVRMLQSKSGDPVEVYREPMDLSRFGSDTPSDPYKLVLRDYLRGKYANKKIDVAVAVMAPALNFLISYGDLIFPGTPIVFCGLDKKELSTRRLPPNAHGVLVKREFAPTLELVLRLHPATKNIVVVSGTSEFDTTLLAAARNEFRPYEDRVSFTYLSDLPFQTLLTTVSQLPAWNIVLFTTLFQDGAGKSFIPHEAVERVSAAASVPVYGFLDQYLGRGILGGSLYSVSAHGAEAAKLVMQILASTAPSEATLEISSNKVMFDWQQMQRWGISERLLPLGTENLFP
jgi:hypothetical protein